MNVRLIKMPTVETAGGAPVDVTEQADSINAQFQAAMNDDGPDEQAPPKRQPRSSAAAEAAGSVEKPRRGRPPKGEQARVKDTPPKDDYTEDAVSTVGTVWTIAASIPVTQPYALVIHTNADALAKSLAEGAKHNATIRAFVASGESTWIIGLASVGMTMSLQTMQLIKDPELRADAADKTREQLKEAIGAKALTGAEKEKENAA